MPEHAPADLHDFEREWVDRSCGDRYDDMLRILAIDVLDEEPSSYDDAIARFKEVITDIGLPLPDELAGDQGGRPEDRVLVVVDDGQLRTIISDTGDDPPYEILDLNVTSNVDRDEALATLDRWAHLLDDTDRDSLARTLHGRVG